MHAAPIFYQRNRRTLARAGLLGLGIVGVSLLLMPVPHVGGAQARPTTMSLLLSPAPLDSQRFVTQYGLVYG